MKQALLIIDVQQKLVEDVYEKERLLVNINQVIQKAKEAKADIIFIRDKDVANGEGPGFEIHPKVNVPNDAEVFDKLATNAFYGTPLKTYLFEHEIGHLVVMGCETQHCIDSAVRTATITGFDVTLVGDGHSTLGSTTLSPEKVIAYHNEILHGHYNVDHFAVVRNTEEDLFKPNHDQYRS
ncbi:isochorismatase family protein [Hazenella sp. IB182353]|uniref:isochorismatase family protein n=1 Tax=Polycladospora coralii TaxID=2771432 RepID=UPI0017473B6E|nr:isochorismatase family protein [Polycladospora coralii]MBS7529002.1 isochorismatase family protein [Polycladospora coralii]